VPAKQAEEFGPCRLGRARQREAGTASPGDDTRWPHGRRDQPGPTAGPLTRKFVVLKLFAPLESWEPYK